MRSGSHLVIAAALCGWLLLTCSALGQASEHRREVYTPHHTGLQKVESNDARIAEVEHSLLPPVLIEGEQPYTLPDRMAFYRVPGVSIAVIEDFKVAWIRNYGVRDVELDAPVTDSTLFAVGSLSKAAAAATILHLIDQGKFGLDDNVNDLLKSWKVPENELTRQSAVTVRRLLNHSGGFGLSPARSYAPDNMPSLIQYLNADSPLTVSPARIEFVPGTVFQYANAGFSTLQILAEDVSGERYPQFAREVLFDPLGMRHTTFEQPLPPDREAYAAAGHTSDGQVQGIKRYAFPALTAGGLWSTAEEYARFVIEIQRVLKGESDLIMSQELAQQMTSPHDAREYGLGVFMRYMDSATYFGHIGDSRGFVAGFTAHPTRGYGAVVMTNGSNGIGLVREITSAIARVYDWETFLPRVHRRYELDTGTMASYAGRYRLDFDNVARVFEKDGSLFYATAGMDDLRLIAVAEDTLVAKERLGHLVFAPDATGEVSTCVPYFADDIGRLPAEERTATRMAEGEQTPLEMLLAGELDKAISSYREHKREFPDDPAVSESRFNNLGYRFLNQNSLAEALAVFRLNLDFYPASGNCWDSYAEALLAAGDKEEALRHYQKAYELDPSNGNAARWIEKLTSDDEGGS
jgi:CubicO group peptidase (beta-lactamase class C family)